MIVRPYLSFNDNCAEAFAVYAEVLRGKITFSMKCGDSPMAAETAPGLHDQILHITLTAGDTVLQGADTPPTLYEKPRGISVSLNADRPADAERIFAELSRGGIIPMAMQKTFRAERFGVCTDRFGIPWMVSCAPA